MSLGQRLKNRFFSLPEEIAAGVKQLSSQSASVTSGLANLAGGSSSPQYQPSKVNLEAGSDLLEHYQNQWELLHVANEKNAKLASKCDQLITATHDKYERQWNNVLTLQMLVSQIPRINEQIEAIMQSLGNLESSFSDVEVALLALEDTIDARELQEKQLEQRFQMAMYQEKRKAEFNQLSHRLKLDYEVKKHEHERSAVGAQKDMQKSFQRKFEEDVAKFSVQGQLRVPPRRDPDASLETVDLNEDESGLEAFLDDVSPLPSDDQQSPPFQTSLANAESTTLASSFEGLDVINHSGENSTGVNLVVGMPPRDVSMYYTPDSTMESLSELNK